MNKLFSTLLLLFLGSITIWGQNVGISNDNTFTPSTLLDIYKDSPSANESLFRLGTSADDTLILMDEDGDLFMQNGNLGIGTTNATSKLFIKSPTSSSFRVETHWAANWDNIIANYNNGLLLEQRENCASCGSWVYLVRGRNDGSGGSVSVNSGDRVGGLIIWPRNSSGGITYAGGIDWTISNLVGTSMSSTFQLKTSNIASGQQTRMVVDSAGNVGIGTTSPTSKFHLHNDNVGTDSSFVVSSAGNVSIGNTITPYKLYVQLEDGENGILVNNVTSTSSLYPEISLNNYLNGNGGHPVMLVRSAEGTGFSPLDVGSDVLLGEYVIGGYDGTQFNQVASIKGYSGPNFSSSDYEGVLTFHTGDALIPSNSPTSEKMRITPLGNVGIGTTDPNEKLQVEGIISLDYQGSDPTETAGYGKLYTKSDGHLYYLSGGATGYNLSDDANGIYDGSGGIPNGTVVSTTGSVDFRNGSVTNLYIDGANSNVGIGTSTTSAKLTIAHDQNGEPALRIVDNLGTGGGIALIEVVGTREDANASGAFTGTLALSHNRTDDAHSNSFHGISGRILFGGNHTDGNESNVLFPASIAGIAEGTYTNSTTMPTGIAFYTGSTGVDPATANVYAGAERMRISSGGNIGIGTSTTNEKLTVEGAISLDEIAAPSNTAGYGKLYVDNVDKNLHFVDNAGSDHDLVNPIPPGALIPYAGSSAPSGWLLCDGSEVNRTTYASLFTTIGTTYGSGDGSSTFNLPDLRGRMPLGQDNMGGTSANIVTNAQADALGGMEGAETHTLTTGEMPSHNHTGTGSGTLSLGAGAAGTTTGSGNSLAAAAASNIFINAAPHPAAVLQGSPVSTTLTITNSGSGNAHNNMPPYITLNYIIKY